jgi:hypothetical protein
MIKLVAVFLKKGRSPFWILVLNASLARMHDAKVDFVGVVALLRARSSG